MKQIVFKGAALLTAPCVQVCASSNCSKTDDATGKKEIKSFEVSKEIIKKFKVGSNNFEEGKIGEANSNEKKVADKLSSKLKEAFSDKDFFDKQELLVDTEVANLALIDDKKKFYFEIEVSKEKKGSTKDVTEIGSNDKVFEPKKMWVFVKEVAEGKKIKMDIAYSKDKKYKIAKDGTVTEEKKDK